MKNRSIWNTGSKKTLISGLMLVMGASLFLGCSKGTATEGKVQKGYSLPEIMVVAMAEKNRYETVCTAQIWETKVTEDGTDFAAYLKEQIKSFMDEMKTMCLLAEEKNVVLSAEESGAMSRAAEEYYDKLTKEDIAYMGVSRESVQTVFEDYCLANKLVEELTKDVNLEVSDSEAKVVSVIQARLDTKEAADSLIAGASQENADFVKQADSAGAEVTTRQLGRAEESKTFEDIAFSMQTGEVSPVIEDGENFYVLKCVNDFDEPATQLRKEVIFKERKRKAFEEIYSKFKGEVSLTYTGQPWSQLELSGQAYAKEADFFEIYEAHHQ